MPQSTHLPCPPSPIPCFVTKERGLTGLERASKLLYKWPHYLAVQEKLSFFQFQAHHWKAYFAFN